jgi:hypothetical protein
MQAGRPVDFVLEGCTRKRRSRDRTSSSIRRTEQPRRPAARATESIEDFQMPGQKKKYYN